MKKANNDVDKFTVKFMTEQYQKFKAGARESWKPVEEYGTIEKGFGSIKNSKQNNNSNNKPAPRVAKATEGTKKRRDRKKCKYSCSQRTEKVSSAPHVPIVRAEYAKVL